MKCQGWWWKIAMVVGVVVGCGGEVEPFEEGSLALQWDVAPVGCEKSGVEEVEVLLSNRLDHYDRRVDCATQAVEFDNIPAGTYELQLLGLRGDGSASFGAGIDEVLVRPGEARQLGRIDLVALPGEVNVQWYFDNRKVCGANGVDEVELTVFDAWYSEVDRLTRRCDVGEVVLDGLAAGEYLFRIRAQSDETRFEGLYSAGVERGGQIEVEVELVEIEDHPR